MKHKDLDHWVNMELRMSDTSKLIYSVVIDNTKTAITYNGFSRSVWIHQSSISDDGFETGVDVVLLSSDVIDVIKNKC